MSQVSYFIDPSPNNFELNEKKKDIENEIE